MIKSIVFIHGYGGGSFEYQPLINFLKDKGIRRFHEFEYEDKRGTASLEKISKKLKQFIEKNVKKDEYAYLLGLSQGGLIASHYLCNFNSNNNIQKCISVCTPFGGSLAAYLISNVGTKQLRPNSNFLKKLRKDIKKKDVEIYGVWNPLDLMVFPGRSAKPSFLKRSKKVCSPIHPTTFFEKKTKDFIYDIVKDK
ncbi:MAG: esterase/lipase family protein [Candidatus Woesearchaeota archaeon]